METPFLNMVVIIAGLLIFIFLLFVSYCKGYNDGEKEGFERGFKNKTTYINKL